MKMLLSSMLGLVPNLPLPEPKFTKMELAMDIVRPGVCRINWRYLERDKYAPWGRGAGSRLPKE